MADSQDTTNLSRRTMLAAITATASLAADILPATASNRTRIATAFSEYVSLGDDLCAAYEAESKAEESCIEPERPIWHPATSEGGYILEPLPNKKCHVYLDDGDKNVARLIEIIEGEPPEDDFANYHPVRQKLARETLEKIRDWQAEKKRREDASGVTIARERYLAVSDAETEKRAEIFEIEAATIQELAYQARILTYYDWSPSDADAVLKRLIALSGVQFT